MTDALTIEDMEKRLAMVEKALLGLGCGEKEALAILERCDMCGSDSAVGICGACNEGLKAIMDDLPKVRRLVAVVLDLYQQGRVVNSIAETLATEIRDADERIRDERLDDAETQAIIESPFHHSTDPPLQ